MAVNDYEMELQSEIVSWECSRNLECVMEFDSQPQHFKLDLSGLQWSIRAVRESSSFVFNIIQVKRSAIPLILSEETAASDLPAKCKLGFAMPIKNVSVALDKLYAFSRLCFQAEKDKRWWIIVDAQITAAACMAAGEATQQAAEAAADIFQQAGDFLVETESFPYIEDWYATTRLFNRRAVEGGNTLQWCSVQVMEKKVPCFEFEVAIQNLLEGDYAISQIGVVNSQALKVRVSLMEDVSVVCSQEGVEAETSLGLRFLLPNLIRDYINAALQRNVDDNENVVQGVLQHVVEYLTFLPTLCMVCGRQREVSWTNFCNYICEARAQTYEDALSVFNMVKSMQTMFV